MGDSVLQMDLFILDGQAMYCQGIVSLLQVTRPNWRCVVLNDLVDLHHHASESPASILIVDLHFPQLGGVAGLAELHATYPNHRLIGLAENDERSSILSVLSAGARGYVPRTANPTQFLIAVETILAGGVFAPASLTGSMQAAPPVTFATVTSATLTSALAASSVATTHVVHDSDALAGLTERQREVFLLLTEGCATKTIARRLNLGVGTVKVHLAAIYRSVGASGRLEAVAKAHRGYAAG
jgi:DNA-binding NarL/FixJ family response regulator